ncbi:MAG: metal-dependent hydrolase [Emcibacteraceae bacterium]|tara:strand:+ start:748 stop:1779 length:1032 start_codon:yes stop_codon:yes gene_type:complete
MDPFTQGLLGAAFSQSFASKKKIPLACLSGTLGGLAPDLDILIVSATDPLLGIEFHRHFTHSIWFIPIGGFLVAVALWFIINKLLKINEWKFKTLYIFTTLGYATHAILDACTSYGTRLFWPFSNTRVAWDTIAVIDPIPTLALFIFVVLSYRLLSVKMARLGIVFMIGYLLLGFIQNQRVALAIKEISSLRGHEIESLKLNPTLGNLIVWRAIYRHNGRYFVDGVIAQPFIKTKIITGTSVATIDPEKIYPQLDKYSTQREDIRRFNYFAQGYLFEYQGTISDLRYGTEPHKIQPIWGIKIKLKTPDAHAEYLGFSRPNGRAFGVLWSMLNGSYVTNQEDLK